MSKKKQDQKVNQGYKYETSHKKPMTRRDLISQGYLGATGYVVAPSILTLLSEQLAFGACPAPADAANRKIPVFIFDCAGGPGLAKMMPPGGEGGEKDFLPDGSYTTIGLADSIHPKNMLNSDYGVGLHSTGALFNGLQSTVGADTNAASFKMGIDGFRLCVSSNDDNQNNPHNIAHAIAKFTGAGDLATVLGSQGTASGGNSILLTGTAQANYNAVAINGPAAVAGLVDKGRLGQLLSDAEVESILKATGSMSNARLAQFQAKTLPDQLKELVSCGYGDALKLATKFNPQTLAPSSDPDVTTVFGANLTGLTGVVATGSKLLADGLAMVMTATVAGCDYHAQATYATKDAEIGTAIGQVLRYFAIKKQPVMVYVFSDGSVACSGSPSATGYVQPAADNGAKAMSFAMVYDPDAATKGRRVTRNSKRQIGSFTSAGNVSTTGESALGGNIALAGQVAVANYLALHGKEGDLSKYVGSSVSNLNNYLMWQKIKG